MSFLTPFLFQVVEHLGLRVSDTPADPHKRQVNRPSRSPVPQRVGMQSQHLGGLGCRHQFCMLHHGCLCSFVVCCDCGGYYRRESSVSIAILDFVTLAAADVAGRSVKAV